MTATRPSIEGWVLRAVAVAALAISGALAAPAAPAEAAPAATAYGWGFNDTWQVGDGTQDNQQHPVRVVVPEGVVFQQVVSGDGTSAALSDDGTVYTWGAGGDGAMGNNTMDSRHTPGPVMVPGVTFTDIAIGSGFMLALSDDGTIYSWGTNGDAQLGNGGRGGNQLVPKPVDMPPRVTFTDIAAGSSFGLALADGGPAYSWGRNGSGQLGNGGVNLWQNSPASLDMPSGVTFTAIAAGDGFGLALADDGAGSLYGWGENHFGQLGIGSGNPDSPTQATMPPGVTFTDVAAGQAFGLALADDGSAYSWGYNGNGQLGDGGGGNRAVPGNVTMPDGVTFTAISVGFRFAAGLTSDGVAYLWGDNSAGQLGIDSTQEQDTPVRVHQRGLHFEALSAGGLHVLALAVPLPQIAPSGGGGQEVHPHQRFPDRLVAAVTYADGTPVPGVEVTFTIHSPATFPGGAATAQATTGEDGTATSPPLTATGESGAVTVAATADGASGTATYQLTVLPAATRLPSPAPSPDTTRLPNAGNPGGRLLVLGVALITGGAVVGAAAGLFPLGKSRRAGW